MTLPQMKLAVGLASGPVMLASFVVTMYGLVTVDWVRAIVGFGLFVLANAMLAWGES